jgi:L-threonylcarbamoyladenylate synthase
VPGALPSHYAPDTPLEIVSADQVIPRAEALLASGSRVAVLRRHHGPWCPPPLLHGFLLPSSPMGFGRQLYARLREIDRFGFDRLLVEAPPQDESWWAVNDRLARAACHQPDRVQR